MRLILSAFFFIAFLGPAFADDDAQFIGDWVGSSKATNDIAHLVVTRASGSPLLTAKISIYCPHSICDGVVSKAQTFPFGDIHLAKPVLTDGKRSLLVMYGEHTSPSGYVILQRQGNRLAYESTCCSNRGPYFSGYLNAKYTYPHVTTPPKPNGPVTAPTKPIPDPPTPPH